MYRHHRSERPTACAMPFHVSKNASMGPPYRPSPSARHMPSLSTDNHEGGLSTVSHGSPPDRRSSDTAHHRAPPAGRVGRWRRIVAIAILCAMRLARCGLTGVVAIGMSLSAVGRAEAGSPEIFPLSKIRRGQTGYGLTTMQGTTPERFTFEVIGVAKNFLPKMDIILVKSDDKKLAVT